MKTETLFNKANMYKVTVLIVVIAAAWSTMAAVLYPGQVRVENNAGSPDWDFSDEPFTYYANHTTTTVEVQKTNQYAKLWECSTAPCQLESFNVIDSYGYYDSNYNVETLDNGESMLNSNVYDNGSYKTVNLTAEIKTTIYAGIHATGHSQLFQTDQTTCYETFALGFTSYISGSGDTC